ncbi:MULTISPECIES: hypothetical protein [unclassified Streptomyces]|uniref:hypothetical protein n=1 Tax=unclassified Streptomyces TaxID=2593676 RepID=UPI000363FBAB|nr:MULTISPECIES: hypothetical protein [unclassified Streptomyces]MYQ79862.1 hypothetical protein [Streptomyces sp. SID4923]NEC10554.1 hypothetical protein [Streptomyces sp. SID7909]OKI93038.1 hypothetical protein AMK18_29985 [Streptomyces sp. CB01249]
MIRKGRIVTAVALTTLSLGLTACNDDEDPAAMPESPSASAPASPTPSSESPSADPSDDAGSKPSGDVAAPGTKFKVGDRAVVPFKYGTSKEGTVAITVTAIEKGTEADMAPFGDKAKGMTPYYIRMKVENVGGTDLSYSSLRLRGNLAGGAPTGVILIGDLPGKCDSETAPRDFTTKGASYETCSLSATKTDPIAVASFEEGDAYRDSPVIWSN